MHHTIIPHPHTGQDYFGQVLEKTIRGVTIPGGPIVLKHGRYGRSGFGAAHIWQRHEKEMRQKGFTTEAEVALYVAQIVVLGTPLFCEFAFMRDVRVTVVRGVIGTAILEHKPHDPLGPCYSIVTAFGARNPIGTRIGKIEAISPPPPANNQGQENETPAKS